MPKFNADELNYEPIEIVLNEKTYLVTEVKQDMFDRIKEASKRAQASIDAGDEDINIIYEQLGIILNVDPAEFKGTDLRKASATVRFLTETITKQVEGSSKNVSGES